MRNDVLEELEKIGVEKVYKKLLAYTLYKKSFYKWNHEKQTTTKGREANDYVGEAILKAIDEEGRNWNKDKCPDLIVYLKGIIRSGLSNSITSKENELGSNLVLHDEKYSHKLPESNYSASKNVDIEDAKIERKQTLKERKSVIDGIAKDDDDYVQFVFEEMLKGYKSEVIAERLEIDINDVYKCSRRIKYALKLNEK